jgi:hypothetical protein
MELPDLMIVRLNEMHYKNKAAPGALEEAVSYRLDRDKPVWMISNIDKPFVEGSHAWSESVFDLINTSFQKISVPRILPKVMLNDSGIVPDMVLSAPDMTKHTAEISTPLSTVSLPIPYVSVPKPVYVPPPPVEPEESTKKPQWKNGKKIKSVPDSDADPLAMYGSGITKSKKKY